MGYACLVREHLGIDSLMPSTHQPIINTEIRVKGKAVFVPSVQIDGRIVISTGKWLKVAAVHDEDLVESETVPHPSSFIDYLKASRLDADIFTFAQKLSDVLPRYDYHMDWDNVAVIPITSFPEWWEKRVESSVRRAVRKSAKEGVTVKESPLDAEFVQGIVNINNETPIRQGRRFWHYQKSCEAVRLENGTYPERTTFLGAYFNGELIGFLRMTYANRVGNIVQLLSMMKHYDKRPANALIAKAVEICAEKGMSHLMYYSYIYNDPNSSLTEFKRRNGFEKVLLPRYHIPLTPKGGFALSVGMQRGLVQRIPKSLLTRLLALRSQWYARRIQTFEGTL
jgi:hypothetical protein